VRAFVFINPGNPTGQCLTAENLQELVRFCYDNSLVMCADEVYQENIYNPARPFVSCRKVMHGMPAPYNATEIASFHTVSKGAYGECGLRGGYMELAHMEKSLVDAIYKICSINLCPNVPGQVSVGMMVNPPKYGELSYPQYKAEKDQVIDTLKRRARMMTDAFNSMEGVSCQEVDGAMYAFPQITLPPAFLAEAGRQNKLPDVLYCLELLGETGLSCVPGSGFKQAPGTFHIRTTILPPEADFERITGLFKSFHKGFMTRYSGSGASKARL
jgi:glutamate--glyoxylate aminotransferase